MSKHYKTDFLPLWWYSGFCSLTVTLWVLNYFFDTNFAAKDNFDILWIAKWWRRWKWDLLSLDEIALLMDRLYLSVTFFSGISKADAERYGTWDKATKVQIIKKYTKPELHHCIQWDQRVLENGNRIDLIDELLEQRIANSNIKFENEYSDNEIIDCIKKNQNLSEWGVLFVLWVSYNVLYKQEKTANDGEWHVVISPWINEEWDFVIYEPIRPRPNPQKISVNQVLAAMHESGAYNFLMIKDNPKHY